VIVELDRHIVLALLPGLDVFHDPWPERETGIVIVVDHHMVADSHRIPLKDEHHCTLLAIAAASACMRGGNRTIVQLPNTAC
jgi:hypothetical protein